MVSRSARLRRKRKRKLLNKYSGKKSLSDEDVLRREIHERRENKSF